MGANSSAFVKPVEADDDGDEDDEFDVSLAQLEGGDSSNAATSTAHRQSDDDDGDEEEETMAKEQAAPLHRNVEDDELRPPDEDFEELALEFLVSHDPNIYFVRRFVHPGRPFVIARRDTPLVVFCKHLAVLENEHMRRINAMNPVSLPAGASDKDIADYVPGILARVVADALQEQPQFMVPVDGSFQRLLPVGAPATGGGEGTNLSVNDAPLVVLDPFAPDYLERVEAVRKMQVFGTQNELAIVEGRVKQNQLSRFTPVGERLPFGAQPTPGYDGKSPVRNDADVWLVVNTQYFLMWKAFEQACEGNGNLLATLKTRMHSTENSVYLFAQPAGGAAAATAANYTPAQERLVLERVLAAHERTLVAEQSIALLQERIRNLGEATASMIDASFVRQARTALGPGRSDDQLAEVLKTITDSAQLLERLRASLAELDQMRTVRSFFVQ